jgi:p-hydroxybenzoate 3-monooxygenase
MTRIRTQIGIVGAGPAGLLLGHLLNLRGIDSVIIENRSRDYVIERVRAGVLEHGTVECLVNAGLGDRLRREGMRHAGIFLAFEGRRHRIDFEELVGRCITIYGQNEIVKDLIHARCAAAQPLYFDVADVTVDGFEGNDPAIRFHSQDEAHEIKCDFIAGCDGFHGICRESLPRHAWRAYEREYPFAWLGILAQAAPSSDELVYSLHERGFALFSMRSQSITRLYLQCAPDESIANWPDNRIWEELMQRLGTADGWRPNRGEILQKGITGMRSFVAEPMRCGRLFFAGDAAHIVPPTGARGLNLAVADVSLLAGAFEMWYRERREDLLNGYSNLCLRRVWRAQRFSSWMTFMLHRACDGDDFEYRRQIAELDYVTGSRAAMTSLAENYTGLASEGSSR